MASKTRRRRRWLALGVAVLLLAVGVPALALADSADPQLPPLSQDLIDRALAQQSSGDQASGGDPYAGLSRSQALGLIEDTFPDQLGSAAGPFADLPTVERYLSNNSAIVDLPDADGQGSHAALADSSIPLRARDDSGQNAPVDLSLQGSPDSLHPANPLVEVSLPKTLSDGIDLPQTGIQINPVGPSTDIAPSRTAEDGVFYPDVQRNVDLAVSPTPTGVETFSQIRSPDSPTTQRFNLDLPAGDQLKATADGGAQVTDAQNEVVVAIPPPTAADANGSSVPTSLVVSGSQLSVSVDATDPGLVYPLLVDPAYEVENWGGGAAAGLNDWNKILTSNADPATHGGAGYYFRQSCMSGWWCFAPSWGPGGEPGLYADALGAIAANTEGAWNYYVPRYTPPGAAPSTYISSISLGGIYLLDRGDTASQPYLFDGTWDPVHGGWTGIGSAWSLDTSNASSNFAPWSGYAQNSKALVFGFASTAAHTLTAYRNGYLGYAIVSLEDSESPTITATGSTAPSGWTASASPTAAPTVADAGLGVKQVSLTVPHTGGTSDVQVRVHPCSGLRASPCPASWTLPDNPNGQSAFSYNTSTMPEGSNTVRLQAWDALAKPTEQDWTVKVDRTAPSISASGPLVDSGNGIVTEDTTLSVNATDSLSGVTSVKVLSDGEAVYPVPDEATQDCPNGGCGLQHAFDVDLTAQNPGPHTIDIVATDAVGNVAHLTRNVTLDPIPPDLSASGSLTRNAGAGPYTLHIDATDGDASTPESWQSGIRSIEVDVNGQKVADSGQHNCTASAGSCPLSLDYTLDPANFTGNELHFKVIATDEFGHAQTSEWDTTITGAATQPVLHVAGALFDAPAGWVQQHDYQVTASAQDPAGATQLQLLIDGQPVGQTSQTCPTGGCSLSYTFTAQMANYSGGSHTAKIVGSDAAGETAGDSWTVNVDPAGQISAAQATSTLQAADATSSSTTVEPTSQTVDPAEIAEGNNPGLQQTGTTLQSTGTPAPSTFTTNPADGFTIQAPDASIHAAPTQVAAGATAADVVSNVAAVPADTASNVDSVIKPVYDGVITVESIRAASAPGTYSWQVNLGSGQTLQAVDNQTAELYYSDGTPAMMIDAQPAQDATGASVPTVVGVTGSNVITLTVSHQGAGFVYPITAGAAWETGYTVTVSQPQGYPADVATVSAPEADIASGAHHRHAHVHSCNSTGCWYTRQDMSAWFYYNGHFGRNGGKAWRDTSHGIQCDASGVATTEYGHGRGWYGPNPARYRKRNAKWLTMYCNFKESYDGICYGGCQPQHVEGHLFGDGYYNPNRPQQTDYCPQYCSREPQW